MLLIIWYMWYFREIWNKTYFRSLILWLIQIALLTGQAAFKKINKTRLSVPSTIDYIVGKQELEKGTEVE